MFPYRLSICVQGKETLTNNECHHTKLYKVTQDIIFQEPKNLQHF